MWRNFMDSKLFDSERKVMEVLWRYGDMHAGELADILKSEIGWIRNTTYTVIKKCVEKGVIERREPKFFCHALITRTQVQEAATEDLIDRLFDGSKVQFFSAFLSTQAAWLAAGSITKMCNRCAKNMSCRHMARTSQQECQGILEFKERRDILDTAHGYH